MESATHTIEAPVEAPQFSLFDAGSVVLSTFLGSPLAGGFVMTLDHHLSLIHI